MLCPGLLQRSAANSSNRLFALLAAFFDLSGNLLDSTGSISDLTRALAHLLRLSGVAAICLGCGHYYPLASQLLPSSLAAGAELGLARFAGGGGGRLAGKFGALIIFFGTSKMPPARTGGPSSCST